MAITNIQTISAMALSASLSITDGSGNNRIAVVMGLQRRSTLNLANLTLNSASPTGLIATVDNSSGGTPVRVIGAYWLDANLPASGGSYTIAMTGPDVNASIVGFSCSGAAQQAPTDITQIAASSATVSAALTAAAGAIALIGLQTDGAATITSNANQTSIYSATRQDSDYDSTDLNIGYSLSFSTPHAALAFALEAAGGASDSIGAIDDPILDGETGNSATYTGFASGAINSVTIDSAGAAVTALNVSDDDAGTVTFDMVDISAVSNDAGTTVPNFGTVTFSFTNGTETATADADINPKAGWSVTTVASVDSVTEEKLAFMLNDQLSLTVADGDEFYFPTASNTDILADSTLETDLTEVSFVYIDRTSANTAYPITWNNGILSTGIGETSIIGIITESIKGSIGGKL